jgi:hypothetical protein
LDVQIPDVEQSSPVQHCEVAEHEPPAAMHGALHTPPAQLSPAQQAELALQVPPEGTWA